MEGPADNPMAASNEIRRLRRINDELLSCIKLADVLGSYRETGSLTRKQADRDMAQLIHSCRAALMFAEGLEDKTSQEKIQS